MLWEVLGHDQIAPRIEPVWQKPIRELGFRSGRKVEFRNLAKEVRTPPPLLRTEDASPGTANNGQRQTDGSGKDDGRHEHFD